ncbi:MAG: hypothetical protein AAF589_00600 [Planctomycetota bacterium]
MRWLQLILIVACTAPPALANELALPSLTLATGQTAVSFCGGAVKFVYDDGWQVSELPRDRQILLVLSRHEPPQKLDELTDGLWIAFSPAVSSDPPLAESVRRGIERDFRRVAVGQSTEALLAGYPGLRTDFELPRRGALFNAPGESKRDELPARRGWRHLAQTPWGRVELQLIAPARELAARERQISGLLALLELSAPQQTVEPVEPAWLAAEQIVGCWKSPAAIMEIGGDGKFVLTYDRKKNYELDKLGMIDFKSPVKKLQGRYAAEQDILRIRWADGSLLNLRWRLAENELLITDHHGRTRRLARLYR